MNNLVEDFHSKIEDANLLHLDTLKSGNISFSEVKTKNST